MYKHMILKEIFHMENEKLRKNREQFNNELKLWVNRKLFEKQLISEDMYNTAKELLLKQAS